MRNETTDAGGDGRVFVHYRKCGCCKHLEVIHLSHGGLGVWGIVCPATTAGHVQSGSASSSPWLMYMIAVTDEDQGEQAKGEREGGAARSVAMPNIRLLTISVEACMG